MALSLTHCRGFSFIEVLLALAILGMLAASLMTFVGQSIRLNRLALERSTATGLAYERLEHLAASPFHPLAEASNYATANETQSTVEADLVLTADPGEIPDHPQYQRTVYLDYDTPVPGMLKVEVVVEWENLGQGSKRHALITYLHPEIEGKQ